MSFSPSLSCYTENVVKSYTRKIIKTLPFDVCPERFLTISAQGSLPISLSYEDDSLNRALMILGYGLKGIYAAYGWDYMFTEPQVIFRPDDPCLSLKIGIMKKDKWKQINKKRRLKKRSVK